VVASWVFEETNLLADIEKNHVPIVMVGRDLTGRGINSMAWTTRREAHWRCSPAELGHRRIAVVRGQKSFSTVSLGGGSKAGCRGSRRQFDPKLIFQLPGATDSISSFEGGLRLARQMLNSAAVHAVLAFDDLTALGVVRGLIGAGLRFRKIAPS